MTIDIEQLISQGRSTGLSHDAKAAVRRSLVGHLQANPIRPTAWTLLTRHALAYSMATVVLFAGGTVALAHRAGPDSLLYPLRLAVNDRVAVALSGNEDAQLTKELAQLDRMINEEEQASVHELDDVELEAGAEVSVEQDTSIDEATVELRALEKDIGDIERDQPPTQ